MEDDHDKHLEASMEAVINTLNTVFMASGKSGGQDQNVSELRRYLKELIVLENEAEKSQKALSRIKSYLNDSLLEGHVLTNIDEMFEESLRTEHEPRLEVNKHKMMAKFESRVAKLMQNTMDRDQTPEEEEVEDTEEEEEEEEEEAVSIVDPVTNKTMTDPVKNTVCGHSYERNSINRLLSKKADLICPSVGCSNPLRKCDLVDDEELMDIISQRE